MLQAWHLSPDPLKMKGVDRSNRCSRDDSCIGENGAPRINNQRVTVTLSALVIHAVENLQAENISLIMLWKGLDRVELLQVRLCVFCLG